MVIHLITSPRNVSTAFMYSMGQRSDTFPVDEPFYACYLNDTGKKHPDREKILQSQPVDRQKIFENIADAEKRHRVVFLKNMAHHIKEEDFKDMKDWKHCFLIRHPKLLIHSFSKIIPRPTLEDLGITTERRWFDQLHRQGHLPYVIDSNQLLENPKEGLRSFCRSMGIAFEKNMLLWRSGPKSYDGCWAHHWYRGTWSSTGFGSPRDPDSIEVSTPLLPLLEKCLIDYRYLFSKIKQ